MTMKLKKILSAVNKETDLSRDNIIEKIKEKLKAADEGEYKKWDEVGFDVNHKFTVEGETLLHLAAASGCTKIVEALLKADNINVNPKDNNERTPLHLAAQEGYEEVVNLLLKREDIDVNAIDKDKHTPLHLAVKKGHIGVVNNLLEVGADVNVEDENGETPLHTAVQFGCGEGTEVLIGEVMIRALIKAGAKVNAGDKDTPLHIAARNGHIEIVETLILSEADVDAEDESKRTPLHFAQGKEIVKILVEARANVNAADEYGCTPLHFAAEDGHKEAIDILMAKGADPLLKNKDGKTPMDLDKNGYIKQFLEKKAIKNGIIAGCATAALSTAIAVTLFATGTVAIELMSVMIAAAIITAVALAVGGITYSILKPSTKMDETKEAQNGNVPEVGKAAA